MVELCPCGAWLMNCCTNAVCSFLMLSMITGFPSVPTTRAGDQLVKVQIHWDRVIRVSQTKPTLLYGASPITWRGAPLHDRILQTLTELGADDVRYGVGVPTRAWVWLNWNRPPPPQPHGTSLTSIL